MLGSGWSSLKVSDQYFICCDSTRIITKHDSRAESYSAAVLVCAHLHRCGAFGVSERNPTIDSSLEGPSDGPVLDSA